MKYKNAIIITGPTTTGKTRTALEAAKRFNGEIINSDRLYIYSSLKIGSGLSNILQYSDIIRHLYEIRKLDESLTTDEYITLVETLVPKILSRNKLPIIEGCSSTYNPALMKCNKMKSRIFYYSPVIALRWPEGTDLRNKIEKRLTKMFNNGLLQEAKLIYNKGFRNAHPIKISVVYNPLMEYFDSKITLRKAKEEIINKWLEVYQLQLETFEKIPEIIWIESDKNKNKSTLKQVIEVIEKY